METRNIATHVLGQNLISAALKPVVITGAAFVGTQAANSNQQR